MASCIIYVGIAMRVLVTQACNTVFTSFGGVKKKKKYNRKKKCACVADDYSVALGYLV